MLKTTNYQLNKPEGTDPVRVDDFNENAEIIDAALATMPQIVCGTYIGDGAASRTIDLGFTPKALYVSNSKGATCYYTSTGVMQMFGGLALPDAAVQYADKHILAIVDGGFLVVYYNGTNYFGNTNGSGTTYCYIALK